MKQLAWYIGIIILLTAEPVHATEVQQKAIKVVAGILLEVPKYLISSKSHPDTICIIDNTRLASEIALLNQRKKSYLDVLQKDKISDLSKCDLVYGTNKVQMRSALTKSALKHTIFISNYSSFVDEGGPIAVLDNNGVIGIELNISAAKKRTISFNPDLIDVSVRVIR